MDLTSQNESIGDEISAALDEVITSQRFILGPEVEALEAEVASYTGAAHAVGVASGTDALLLPLKALAAEPGSHVIVPSFTFFATAGAVWNAGLRPVFCDVDPTSFNLDPNLIESLITPRTRAILPVHVFGTPCDVEAIDDIARRHNLKGTDYVL